MRYICTTQHVQQIFIAVANKSYVSFFLFLATARQQQSIFSSLNSKFTKSFKVESSVLYLAFDNFSIVRQMFSMKFSVSDPGHSFSFVSVLGVESPHTSGGLQRRGAWG